MEAYFQPRNFSVRVCPLKSFVVHSDLFQCSLRFIYWFLLPIGAIYQIVLVSQVDINNSTALSDAGPEWNVATTGHRNGRVVVATHVGLAGALKSTGRRAVEYQVVG